MVAKFSNIDGKVYVNNIEIIDSESWNKVIDSITELQQENQQLKIQVSAREEEYRKLEDIINDYKFVNNRVKQGMNAVNKEKMLIEIGNKILQELEKGKSE